MIIASFASCGRVLIFTMCSVSYRLSNDLKVRWTRINKLVQLRTLLLSLFTVVRHFQSGIEIALKNAQLSGSIKVCDIILQNFL